MSVWSQLKHKLAANLLDAPRYALVLRTPGLAQSLFGRSWVDLCNRRDQLRRRPGQRGVLCDWTWTRALFYCQAYPRVGQQLLHRALADWPVELRDAPAGSAASEPEVSFIVGHRGTARLPHLLATIRSIAAQVEVAVECLVVEQVPSPAIAEALPGWVRYLHTPPPWEEMPYSRSWAFNVGARAARGRYLVFHDNDVPAPARYAAEVVQTLRGGFEAARLQRFVFYLNEEHTKGIFEGKGVDAARPPVEVLQNCEGHTLAVERDTYFRIGGHDETFLGWGGEDNEMLDRLRTQRLHDHAYLPFVHLAHAPQPGKGSIFPNTKYFESRMRLPAEQRIRELSRLPIGELAGPTLPSDPRQNGGNDRISGLSPLGRG
jgi:N-terminal domain of galactosyltransferase